MCSAFTLGLGITSGRMPNRALRESDVVLGIKPMPVAQRHVPGPLYYLSDPEIVFLSIIPQGTAQNTQYANNINEMDE